MDANAADEIREYVTSVFQRTTKEGPLCEQTGRDIYLNIQDVTLYADSIHRDAGQMCLRRAG
eukprot:11566158-Heterocapsa_arctica.AAC.1